MELLTARYAENLAGVLSCYDRIVITGTLPGACFADGMTSFLNSRGIRIFDYPRFALPLRERIRENAQALAAEHGATIQHIAKAHIRKEDVVARVLAARGDAAGLVHVISAMETCPTYQPWHDKASGRTFLRPDTTKCLHYYFYWIDRELGLIYVRVPTYCPFRLQVYCNGHSWLARRLARAGIDFTAADNALVRIADFTRAQQLADTLKPELLHRHLDRYARLCCPVLDVFEQRYHWSLMQTEYSTDLVFKSARILGALYEQLSREAVLCVKAEHVATFLGKKITPQLAAEIGSRLSTRIEGTCIRHRLGSCSVKIYDKFGCVLRIETTTNDVSFFKHHRRVEHRSGHCTRQIAPLKKSIYSLIDLRQILLGCNQRYLQFLSSLDDHSDGQRRLERLAASKPDGDRAFKGLNFFDANDQALLRAVQRPAFNLHGMARRDLHALLPHLSPSTLSRQLRRLRVFGLLKRAANTYRYYLTRTGRLAIAAFERLTTFAIVPALARARLNHLNPCQFAEL
jgi:hypothetical protein